VALLPDVTRFGLETSGSVIFSHFLIWLIDSILMLTKATGNGSICIVSKHGSLYQLEVFGQEN
jgi:hypothetical protein